MSHRFDTRRRFAAVVIASFTFGTVFGAPPPLSRPGSRDTVLVVAPHPDDESLCCAGVVRRAITAGAKVAIVWVTSGDAFELDAVIVERSLEPGASGLQHLAQQRMQEARTAASGLGIPASRQIFLGYPDRGLLALLVDHYATPYRSAYTAATRVPYTQALSPAAPYTGRSLERDFAAVLDAIQPTLVLAPSPLDAHPDHRAVGSLVVRAMSERGQLAARVVDPRMPRAERRAHRVEGQAHELRKRLER